MRIRRTVNHPPSTNGAPQVIAVCFTALLVFMMLLPIAEISLEGTNAPQTLIQMVRTDHGINLFALVLFIAPVVGIAEAMIARSVWRGASMTIALIAVIMIPLVILSLNRQVRSVAEGAGGASLGVGGYVLLVGYVIIVMITGVSAFRAWRRDRGNERLHTVT